MVRQLLPTAFYFIPSAMTGSIVNVFPFRNRVSYKEAFEGLELGEGKPSRPVLRGPGGRKAAWLLGSQPSVLSVSCRPWRLEDRRSYCLDAGFESSTSENDSHAIRVNPSSLQSSLPTPWWTKNNPSGSYLSLILRSLG